MKRVLKAVLVGMTNNRLGQLALAKTADVTHYLMGIGAGSDVEASGESAVFRFLQPWLGSPVVIFDVGANMGQFLTVARTQLHKTDAVFQCFEPSHTGYAAMQRGFGQCHDVFLNKLAVGRQPGRGDLWYDSPGSGLASLTRRDLGHFGIRFDESESVEITTIDRYCSDCGIERIDLLKMDIEGHELDALNGAATMFGRHAINAVMFEFGGCNIDTRTFFRDFWQFFESHGMQLLRVAPGGYLCPIDRYVESLEQFRTMNVLAVRPRQSEINRD